MVEQWVATMDTKINSDKMGSDNQQQQWDVNVSYRRKNNWWGINMGLEDVGDGEYNDGRGDGMQRKAEMQGMGCVN